MTSPVILNGIFLTFINEPPTIEATNLSHIHLLGSSILALDPYPFVFINTAEGPFFFPLSLRLLLPRDVSEPKLCRRRRPSYLHQPRPLHQPDRTRATRRSSAVPQHR